MHFIRHDPRDNTDATTERRTGARMNNRIVRSYQYFKVYSTLLGGNQAYISATVTDCAIDVSLLTEHIYRELMNLLQDSGFQIVHERIFASLEFEQSILMAREQVLGSLGLPGASPYTFIQGNPVAGRGLAGIQLRAYKPEHSSDKIWTIFEQDRAVGRGWTRNGASFRMLQNIYGSNAGSDRYHQACDMFDRAQEILKKEGLSFKNVLRTWIYLSRILDWYGEFNRARNARFTEFGLLGLSEKENREAEQIYLPASTGILGENPLGAVSVMDVFAVAPNSKNISIAQTTGVQQMSPYRYGSAFSRAVTLKEADVTHILLSGTASIDEHGKTVHIDDMRAQIRKTFSVVKALIEKEGASLQDINEATVFLKDERDIDLYWDVANELDVTDLPAVFMVADVCRVDLLFEIDAAIAF